MMRLSRSAFGPPPKVASAVVHITPREAAAGVDPERIELGDIVLDVELGEETRRNIDLWAG